MPTGIRTGVEHFLGIPTPKPTLADFPPLPSKDPSEPFAVGDSVWVRKVICGWKIRLGVIEEIIEREEDRETWKEYRVRIYDHFPENTMAGSWSYGHRDISFDPDELFDGFEQGCRVTVNQMKRYIADSRRERKEFKRGLKKLGEAGNGDVDACGGDQAP